MSAFSIVLPVRNGGDYFRLCVNSILAQRHPHFDLVVLDNNSTDGTYEWISAQKNSQITVHRSDQSLTIGENWARATNVKRNEFMTLIGHDDILAPHYLEEMENLISRHPEASLYQAHFSYISKNGGVTRHCLPMDEVQTAFEFLACQMNGTIDSTGTGYMFRTADFDRVGGMSVEYPNLIFSDYQLWITLSRLNYKATSPKTCFLYREHDSVSRKTDGVQYHIAFGRYVSFMETLMPDKDFERVISRYGQKMLLHYCQSLAHRLLKTPVKDRSIRVQDLLNDFSRYAAILIPGQEFDPLSLPRTKLARNLDRFAVGRSAFNFYKKLSSY